MVLRIAIVLGLLSPIGCGARSGLRAPDAARSDVSDDRAAMTMRDTGQTVDVPPMDAIDTAVSLDVFETDNAVTAALNGLRWELPCIQAVETVVCTTPGMRVVTATLLGARGDRYRATLRFRGVVEEKQYLGGTTSGVHWQIGGTPVNDPWNVYQLEISSPPQIFYLNRGTTGLYQCSAIDETQSIEMDVGASITLSAFAIDAREIRNLDGAGRPIVIAGVAPAPAPFDGQFIQMDVVGVVQVR